MKTNLLVALIFAVVTVNTHVATCGEQQAAKLDTQVKVQLGYLLYLPVNYDKQESWPLLLFLHGSGERGDDLELVKRHGPPRLIAAGKDFPFIVVSPQCPKDQWWEPIELLALLDDITSKHRVDELKENGGSPKLTIYPDAGHDAWTETYNNPKFYEWLLEQKRKN